MHIFVVAVVAMCSNIYGVRGSRAAAVDVNEAAGCDDTDINVNIETDAAADVAFRDVGAGVAGGRGINDVEWCIDAAVVDDASVAWCAVRCYCYCW